MANVRAPIILKFCLASGVALLTFLVFYLKPAEHTQTYADFILLEKEIEDFQDTHRAVKLDLGLQQGAYVREGLESSHHLNFFSEERFRPNVQTNDHDCSQTVCDPLSIVKDDIYKSYMCGLLKTLPFNFFNQAPYIAHDGYSFVFKAFHSGFPEFSSGEWLKVHRQFLSLPELMLSQSVRTALKLDTVKVPSSLMSLISAGSRLIAHKKQVYIKERSSKLVYKAYGSNKLKQFLNQKKLFTLTDEKNNTCVLKGPNFCFIKSSSETLANARALHNVLLLLLTALVLIAAGFYFIKSKKETQQSNLRKLALDNLTHDFRTPVTNMVLMTKDLDLMFQQSPHHDQIKWLNFSSQVHKLHRATEDTKNYIQLLASNQITKKQISPMHSWLSMMCDEDITLKLGPQDFSIQANPYWLNVCLKNLIKNARDHGGEPITVQTHEAGRSHIEIQVVDSGPGLSHNFKDTITEFSKGHSSSGLGLGLSIVAKAAQLMGAELTYSSSPTAFSIKFKKEKKKHEEHTHC